MKSPVGAIGNTPLLSALMAIGLVIGIPIAFYILFTQWSESPQRQAVAWIGIFSIAVFTLQRRKYELILIALVFFSQFQISLHSIILDEPARLQIFFTDILFLLFIAAGLERKERFSPDAVGWIFLSLILWQIISTVFFTAHVGRSIVFLMWQLKYLLVYLFVRNLHLTEKIVRQTVVAVVFVIFMQTCLALAQQFKGGTLGLVVLGEQEPSRLFFVKDSLRVSGTLGGTNALAGYLAMMLVFIFPFLFRKRSILTFIIFGIGVVSLLMALSRAGWLSFLFGTATGVFGVLRAKIVRPTRILFVGTLGGVLIGATVVAYFDKIEERFQDKNAIASAEGRFYQIFEAWPVIEKYPLFGIGPGVTEYFGAWNENEVYIRNKLPNVRLGNQPHNSHLQYWIEGGALGFVLFTLIFLMVFATALRKPRLKLDPEFQLLKIGASSGAVAAMVHASFGTEINNHQIFLVFWIFLALARNHGFRSIRALPVFNNRTRYIVG